MSISGPVAHHGHVTTTTRLNDEGSTDVLRYLPRYLTAHRSVLQRIDTANWIADNRRQCAAIGREPQELT